MVDRARLEQLTAAPVLAFGNALGVEVVVLVDRPIELDIQIGPVNRRLKAPPPGPMKDWDQTMTAIAQRR